MSRYERYGTRDLTYSSWHRTLSDDLTYIDVDALEYCRKCRAPLALVELAQDVGQAFKATMVLRRLAEKAKVPAYLVFYRKGEIDSVDRFRVRRLFPENGKGEYIVTPSEFASFLTLLRSNHRCYDPI